MDIVKFNNLSLKEQTEVLGSLPVMDKKDPALLTAKMVAMQEKINKEKLLKLAQERGWKFDSDNNTIMLPVPEASNLTENTKGIRVERTAQDSKGRLVLQGVLLIDGGSGSGMRDGKEIYLASAESSFSKELIGKKKIEKGNTLIAVVHEDKIYCEVFDGDNRKIKSFDTSSKVLTKAVLILKKPGVEKKSIFQRIAGIIQGIFGKSFQVAKNIADDMSETTRDSKLVKNKFEIKENANLGVPFKVNEGAKASLSNNKKNILEEKQREIVDSDSLDVRGVTKKSVEESELNLSNYIEKGKGLLDTSIRNIKRNFGNFLNIYNKNAEETTENYLFILASPSLSLLKTLEFVTGMSSEKANKTAILLNPAANSFIVINHISNNEDIQIFIRDNAKEFNKWDTLDGKRIDFFDRRSVTIVGSGVGMVGSVGGIAFGSAGTGASTPLIVTTAGASTPITLITLGFTATCTIKLYDNANNFTGAVIGNEKMMDQDMTSEMVGHAVSGAVDGVNAVSGLKSIIRSKPREQALKKLLKAVQSFFDIKSLNDNIRNGENDERQRN